MVRKPLRLPALFDSRGALESHGRDFKRRRLTHWAFFACRLGSHPHAAGPIQQDHDPPSATPLKLFNGLDLSISVLGRVESCQWYAEKKRSRRANDVGCVIVGTSRTEDYISASLDGMKGGGS